MLHFRPAEPIIKLLNPKCVFFLKDELQNNQCVHAVHHAGASLCSCAWVPLFSVCQHNFNLNNIHEIGICESIQNLRG